MKTNVIFVFVALVLLCSALCTNSISAADTSVSDFPCQYYAANKSGNYAYYLAYGCSSTVLLNNAEASAAGIPAGFADSVLVVESTSASKGVLFDFSSLNIPAALVETMTFRVYVGDDKQPSDAYPEFRIMEKGSNGNRWVLRYDASIETGRWVEIKLSRSGTNLSGFYDGHSFSDLANENGILDKFEFSCRSKGTSFPFYIDSVSYTLEKDTTSPIIQYNGTTELYAAHGKPFPLQLTATDNSKCNVSIQYLWSDALAINADGTLNEGKYFLTVKATDWCGNESVLNLTISVLKHENNAPTIDGIRTTALSVTTGTKPYFVYTINDDSGIVNYNSYFSDGALDARGCLNAGVHTYTVIATDIFENQTKIILTLTVTDTINYGNIIDEEALCSKTHESNETTKESAMTNNNEASYLFKLALPYTTVLSESKRKNPFDQ